jgi:hypothetical protein
MNGFEKGPLGLLFARHKRDFLRKYLSYSRLPNFKMGSFGNFHFLDAGNKSQFGGVSPHGISDFKRVSADV